MLVVGICPRMGSFLRWERSCAVGGRAGGDVVGPGARRTARDRSRSMGRKLRAISRTTRWRSGEAKSEVLALTEQLVARSVKEAHRLAATATFKARRGAQGQATRCGQARRAGRPLREGRLPDQAARRGRENHRPTDPWQTPTRGRSARASLASPTSSGTSRRSPEVTPNTKRGAHGLILPTASLHGNPQRERYRRP